MEGYEKQMQCEQACQSDLHCGGVSVQYGSNGGQGKGGESRAFFRPANCTTTLRRLEHNSSHTPPGKADMTSTLLLLRDIEMPRPPEVEDLPPKCNLFALEQVCMNVSDGYRTIPVNVCLSSCLVYAFLCLCISYTFRMQVSLGPPMHSGFFGNHRMLDTSDLGKCCTACLEDGDKCK